MKKKIKAIIQLLFNNDLISEDEKRKLKIHPKYETLQKVKDTRKLLKDYLETKSLKDLKKSNSDLRNLITKIKLWKEKEYEKQYNSSNEVKLYGRNFIKLDDEAKFMYLKVYEICKENIKKDSHKGIFIFLIFSEA